MESKEEEHEEGGVADAVTTTRIFVGGLGESVRKADLNNTFSPLGIVKNIEIIRTNGRRSFAYMDFLPSSSKSLSKLFGTYNGCIWKGGRLRLEKAKEHYLLRLKREWAEDAELGKKTNDVSGVNKNINIHESSKFLVPCKTQSKRLIPNKAQLHIFFPQLRKLKPLPYTGTGKHKYSFQRVEVPSLPINFCDCEEHHGSSESAKKKQVAAVENQSSSVNEEEVNMMTSVMNNIFKRSLNLRNHGENTEDSVNGETFYQSIDDSPVDESESDQEGDVDNLVTNMVRSGNSKLKKQGQDKISEDQESKLRKRQFSGDGPTQSKFKAQKGNRQFPSEPISRKQPASVRSNREEFMSSEPKRKGDLKPLPKESSGLRRAESSEQKASVHKSGDLSWIQKSSWRQLIGEISNNSFSISNILQGSSSKDQLKSKDLDSACSNDVVNHNLVKQLENEPTGECSEPFDIGKDENLHSKVTGGSILVPTETPCKDSTGPQDAEPSEAKAVDRKRTGGSSWIQKSSWKELVGDVDNSSFSICNILPSVQNLPKLNNLRTVSSKDSKVVEQLKSGLTGGCNLDGNLVDKSTEPSGSKLEAFAVEEQISARMGVLHNKLERNSWKKKDDNGEPSENKIHKRLDKKPMVEAGVGEFCSFMRSAASEREWMKTRATLSGALKKKSNQQ